MATSPQFTCCSTDIRPVGGLWSTSQPGSWFIRPGMSFLYIAALRLPEVFMRMYIPEQAANHKNYDRETWDRKKFGIVVETQKLRYIERV